MPREFFHSDHDTPDRVLPQATVGWDRSPGVQVGVIHNPHEVQKTLSEQLGQSTDLSVESIDKVVAALTGPESPALGWHTTLGRSEINRLIRTLRRARDASFGADA